MPRTCEPPTITDYPYPEVSHQTLWALLRSKGRCACIEPNQSLANAAICDRSQGHDGFCEGFAHGPAAVERPGRHTWAEVHVI